MSKKLSENNDPIVNDSADKNNNANSMPESTPEKKENTPPLIPEIETIDNLDNFVPDSIEDVATAPRQRKKPETRGRKKKMVDVKASEVAATQITNLVLNSSVMLFGSEWQPVEGEALAMKLGFRDYFDAKGIIRIPPEIGLALCLGLYALPRLRMPETQSRLQKFVLWVKSFRKNK